jgi:hypothetical protein
MPDANEGPASPPSTDVLHKLRRAQRGAAILLVLVVLICGEHWIRGDDAFPFWIYLLLGGSCIWMLAGFTYMVRAIERKRRTDELEPKG